MPIKWSALAVSKAMDEVESQLNLAESFLAEAEAKVRQATGISNLPQYLDQRLHRLIYTIEYRDRMKASIEAVRDAIPDGVIEAEREHGKYGTQQSLV